MKNILLVTHGVSSSNETVRQAAVECGQGLRHASTSHDALDILAESADDIDIVILDLNPGLHSVSILEAISYRKIPPPIIVVTGFEDMEMVSMAHRHGATACIPKSFTSCELAALIKDILLPEWKRIGGTSDRWGHIKQAKSRTHRRYERLHCMSL